jgi:hypothetical protein
MSFIIRGLDPALFAPLHALPDEALAANGALRRRADKRPGFPCRITLEDAEPGETVILTNFVSHDVPTPYRSAFAIYVRETAREAAVFEDETPPVMRERPIALRIFDENAMLIGAALGRNGAETAEGVRRAFDDPAAAYLHAHNAMHGCFVASIERA